MKLQGSLWRATKRFIVCSPSSQWKWNIFHSQKTCLASFVYMILWERTSWVGLFCLHFFFQNHFCQAADVRLVQAHSEGHGGHNHPQLPWNWMRNWRNSRWPALHFGTKDHIRKHTYTWMEGMWVYTYIKHLNNILYIYICIYKLHICLYKYICKRQTSIFDESADILSSRIPSPAWHKVGLHYRTDIGRHATMIGWNATWWKSVTWKNDLQTYSFSGSLKSSYSWSCLIEHIGTGTVECCPYFPLLKI